MKYIILLISLVLFALIPIQGDGVKESPSPDIATKLVEALKNPAIAKAEELDIVPITSQDYVRMEAKKYGWDKGAQWDAITTLLNNESGWRWDAVNSTSGACGLFQALPCSKLGGPLTDIANQASWGIAYISRNYTTPTQALGDWYSRSPHWY